MLLVYLSCIKMMVKISKSLNISNKACTEFLAIPSSCLIQLAHLRFQNYSMKCDNKDIYRGEFYNFLFSMEFRKFSVQNTGTLQKNQKKSWPSKSMIHVMAWSVRDCSLSVKSFCSDLIITEA